MNDTKPPIISAIVAMDENRAIGLHNQLPWHLPADLKHFKAITSGHPIVMGRKTHQSIGKPLPNRTNIILTRDPRFQAPGCEVVTSLEAALKKAANAPEIFIIGGSEIYNLCLSHIQRLYITVVHHAFQADAFFPEINLAEWRETVRDDHPADTENAYAFSFLTLEKM